jgi:hypothetical protein
MKLLKMSFSTEGDENSEKYFIVLKIEDETLKSMFRPWQLEAKVTNNPESTEDDYKELGEALEKYSNAIDNFISTELRSAIYTLLFQESKPK